MNRPPESDQERFNRGGPYDDTPGFGFYLGWILIWLGGFVFGYIAGGGFDD
jgi:hypothetical protein